MSYEYNPKSNVVFGDVDLSDYNAYAVYCNIFDRPERDISVVSVPGRNGDLIFDNGRYKNVDRTYQIHVVGVENVHNLIRDLVSTVGYQRLEDEYDPNVYMMARIKGKPNVRKFVGNAVLLTVTFDRMPQRWDKNERLTTSEDWYSLYDSERDIRIYNPSAIFAKVNNNNSYTMLPIVGLHIGLITSDPVSLFSADVFQSKTPIPVIQEGNNKSFDISNFYTDWETKAPKEDVFLFRIDLWTGTEFWDVGESHFDITIDSEQKIIYKGNKNINAAIKKYIDFPQITEGDNYIYVILTNPRKYSLDVNARKWTI